MEMSELEERKVGTRRTVHELTAEILLTRP